ncbi:MAG: Na(+)/H(+) antiporter subunit B [Spirochaetota bacterium]
MIEILLVIMLLLALLALLVRDLLGTVVLMGVFSLVSCLVFYILGAPDVALTEAAVGTGVGTVVFIWIVYKTERRDRSGSRV